MTDDSNHIAILFLDDDLDRCKTFLASIPYAVIVHTAEDCIAQLQAKSWFECHLDHDLNGQTYCDSDNPDTGMEVVRWICLAKPDVRTFVVHTGNDRAAPLMVDALRAAGYWVIRRWFGLWNLGLDGPQEQPGD